MRKWYRHLKEPPLGASDLLEPFRAAISQLPGVVKVRAIMRERGTPNEKFEFTITVFYDFQEGEMRETVVEGVDYILRGFVNNRHLRVKDNMFTVVVQRHENWRSRYRNEMPRL